MEQQDYKIIVTLDALEIMPFDLLEGALFILEKQYENDILTHEEWKKINKVAEAR